MAWSDELAAGLPTQRDDEPTTLRQEIVDELSDHLQCALQSERHRTDDEERAKQNVINRFGNPIDVARRLWFDEMKERIMSQRITMISAGFMAAACLFVSVIAWQMSQQSRETNLAILEKLELLSLQSDDQKSLDWNPVKIRLVTGAENGPPAVGFKATLTHSSGVGLMPPLEETSDTDGMLDFGQVRFGQYSLSILSPWSDRYGDTISVRPGQAFSKTIVCPTELQQGNVTLEIDWPADLKAAGLTAYCTFLSDQTSPPRSVGETVWQTWPLMVLVKGVMITSSGAMQDCGFNDLYFNNHYQKYSGGFGGFQLQFDPQSEFQWYERSHKLKRIKILVWSETPGSTEMDLPKEPLAWCAYEPVQLVDGIKGIIQSMRLDVDGRPVRGVDEVDQNDKPVEAPTFQVKPNQPNHWKITLPKELVSAVREKLAAQQSTEKEPG